MTGGLRLGVAEVFRVTEWLGTLGPVTDLFPDTAAQEWEADPQLAPHFYEPTTHGRAGLYRAAIQTWVVRVGGATVLVDTGVGNGRDRPQVPRLAHLRTDFLDRLAAVGVTPDQVDVVVNTHIHYDHVGWNTRWVDGAWVPTFPNATYVVPEADYDYFHPDNAGRMRPPRNEDEERRFTGIRLVFADSIAPVDAAGQLTTWRGGHDLPGGLHLHPAPGHTPGSSVLWLDEGPGAVFVGDLLHSPVQVSRPEVACAFDLDANQARTSRRDVLSHATGSGSLVLPAHLPGHGAFTPTSPTGTHNDAFAIGSWADLPAQ